MCVNLVKKGYDFKIGNWELFAPLKESLHGEHLKNELFRWVGTNTHNLWAISQGIFKIREISVLKLGKKVLFVSKKFKLFASLKEFLHVEYLKNDFIR